MGACRARTWIVDIRLVLRRQFGTTCSGDAGGRRHPLQLDPDPAAAIAGAVRLHRHLGRAGADARRAGDVPADADLPPPDHPGVAEIPDHGRHGGGGAGDVALHHPLARRGFQLFRLVAGVPDDRAAIPVLADHRNASYAAAARSASPAKADGHRGRGQATAVIEVAKARDEYAQGSDRASTSPICSDGGISQDYHVTLAPRDGRRLRQDGPLFRPL